MTANTINQALLLATLPHIDPPHFLVPVITTAATLTKNRLVIVLFSRYFNSTSRRAAGSSPLPSATGGTSLSLSVGGGGYYAQTRKRLSHTAQWDDIEGLLTFVYVQATKVAQDLEKVLMEVDVLLLGLDEEIPESLAEGTGVVFRVAGDAICVPLPLSIGEIRSMYLTPGDLVPEEIELSPRVSPSSSPRAESSRLPGQEDVPTPHLYPVVALGGTFDHLHAGHKILLSMGAWIASEKIIVGITDDALLQKKAHKHVLQKMSERIARVRDFLSLFKPGIVYDIVPISDVYGPTGWDANIQALVVSKETLSGAESIHDHRATHDLPALRTFVIDVISPTSRLEHDDLELLKATKMSSTFIREWIVNHNKREEEETEEEANGAVTRGVVPSS